MSRRVVVDVDPGVDDALALLLAFASPELKVEAITVVNGNVAPELGVRNALLTLEAAGITEPPPVAAGCDRPLAADPLDAKHVHGEDGLGGAAEGKTPRLQPVKTHAVDLLLETIRRFPDELTLIAVGPLTNVATAIERDAATIRRLKEIILMGGSVAAGGNVTAAAEYNFYADPEAAQATLNSGVPITQIGLDVTLHTLLERSRFEAAVRQSNKPGASFALEVSAAYFDWAETHRGVQGCLLHDPLAVGAAIDPTFIRTEELWAEVETAGKLSRGALIADRRQASRRERTGGNIRAAMEVDADRFLELFVARVCG